ncbi:MAG: hypothetical protein LBI63_00595, partial [Candidatus Ancillula sp.]|nr:hypothetical protein [Candidatus Ancillula sp.]
TTSEIKKTNSEIINIYHGLSRIEDSFRITKSDLVGRPVYVWCNHSIATSKLEGNFRVSPRDFAGTEFIVKYLLHKILLLKVSYFRLESTRFENVIGMWYNSVMKDILKEFCADGFELVPKAVECGARRIELCKNLEVGGVTPDVSVIMKCVDYCAPLGVETATMVRPRGGNFVYNTAEKTQMSNLLEIAIQAKSEAVVLGALTQTLQLDVEFLEHLVVQNDNRADLVFHMAFDEVLMSGQKQAFTAVDTLVQLGFKRILTHGGSPHKTVMENADVLNRLIDYASDSITILPGGGITTKNLVQLSQMINSKEFHGTRIVF